MNSRLLFAGVAVAATAAGIYFATADSTTPPAPVPTEVSEEFEEEQTFETRSSRTVAERNEADPVQEDEAETPMQMLGVSENARVLVVGRVVDSLGGPVAGAKVDVAAVIDPRRMFERVERGNMDPREIGARFFGGGGRGGRGGRPDFRSMMAPRPIAEGLETDAQGRFEVEGETLEVGRIQVSVRHPAFAPQIASQGFDLGDEGPEVTLEDIQVENGARLVGYVVDSNGTGVPGAEVSIEARGGFGRGGRGRSSRGFNPFGGRANANQLVESVVSDATGRFLMANVPSGDVRLVATARSYTRARSESVEVTAGQEIDAGTLKLGPGAIVRGTVTDVSGQPLAGVSVTGTFSREGARQAAELERAAQGAGGATAGNQNERGGRRGQSLQRMGRGGFGDRQETTTDENGQYELDQVPATFVRIEFEDEKYIDTEVDPVEPSKTPVVDAVMQDLIRVRGRVTGQEGEPVEFYAIAARRVGSAGNDPFGRGRDRGRPARGGAPGAPEDPTRAARAAEREAEQAREQAVRQQLLGGTGRTPRPAGDQVAHENGEFELEGLEPGTYVFDIQAKGYASVAVGELELVAGQPVADQNFRIERGITLVGVVVDSREKKPVENARVTLRLPDLDGNNDNERGNPFGFGGRGRGNFRSTIQSVRTDEQGRFELEPQRPGTYGLSIDARDFPGYRDDGMRLAGTGEQDIRIELSNGSRVFGTVTGLAEGQRGRVVLTNADTGLRRTANVDAKSFEYEVSGLPDGGYTVVLEERGGRGGNWRSRVGQFVASQTGEPEVFINGDADVRHDIDATAVELPSVTGRILRNGQAAAGLSVRLNPESEEILNAGGSGARRFAGALFSGNADPQTGEFEIESVPEGEYTLEVRAGNSGGRGGRGGPRLGGGGPVLSTQKLLVRKGVANDVFIDVQLGTISLKIVDPDGNPAERVAVEAVLEQETLGIETSEWRNQPSFQRLTIRNGELESSNAPVGFFKLRVRSRNYKEKIVDLQVVPGDVATPLEIQLEANEPEPAQGGGGF